MKFKKFLKKMTLTAAFMAASLGIYSYKVEPNLLKTTTYDLDSSKWPKSEPPLNIAMAADFHVGCPSVDLDRLAVIVERINALHADIILLPGDFLTMVGNDRVIGGEFVPPEDIAKVLKNLKAPLGVYAVLGNHDVKNAPVGTTQALEKAGIHVLDNDAVHIKSQKYDFWAAGLADDTTRDSDWKKTSAKITDNAPVILIMHDPGSFVHYEPDRPVVSLAGHMHGGQVVFPFESHFNIQTSWSRAS